MLIMLNDDKNMKKCFNISIYTFVKEENTVAYFVSASC